MVFLQFEKSLAINVHSVRKEAFFRFLYFCIISIGCWVNEGQPVKLFLPMTLGQSRRKN